jgi:DNA-dependent RNA polymerase auxiliary subunit epsilon/predicted transcriptional regulator
MPQKNKAFELFNNGFSYSEIALELSISKSTAHKYVQEMKSQDFIHNRANESNSNDKAFSVRSEKRTNEKKSSHILTGNELVKKKFHEIKFTGKFLELIGKPSKPFSAIIWGKPKGGKSSFSIRFADYLQEYFGSVCYFASEEGISSTLKLKLIDIGGSNALFSSLRDKNKIREYLKENQFDFVFIDSINKACIDHEFLELLKEESPETSFIAIVQATKGGNFKGDQALTHNCDFVIKVIEGIAYYEGRFNHSGQIEIFTEDLYTKNPNKKQEKKCDNESKIEPDDNTPKKNLGEIIVDAIRKSNANKVNDNDKKSIKDSSAYLDFIKKYKIY